MFREYDLRGMESEEELNPYSLELIGRGYGTFLLRRGIKELVLGRDNRGSSESFSGAALKGLLETGCDVVDIGVVTVPMLYWSQYYFERKGGMMVTASHNPLGWNGVKLAMGYSYTIIGKELEEIYDIITTEQFLSGGKGSVKEVNVTKAYVTDLVKRVAIRKKMRVLVNTGNGTAGFIVPKVLRQAGCEVIERYTESDPTFPHYTPNPAQIEMMEDTSTQTKNNHADLGFAFDADGDRLGLVDEKGQNIWPDRYLILLSRLVLEKQPGSKIVFDVKCSQALEEDIRAHGGVPIMWKTGHSYIKEKMRDEEAPLAGEMSGHIFIAQGYYGFDDALFASLKLLEYFSHQESSVSELIKSTPYYISSPALNAPCPDEKKYEVVEKLTKEFKEKYEVIDINGARVLFGDGWGLVRASSNIPALVLRFEAKTEKRLNEIEMIFREKLRAFPFVGVEWRAA